MTVGSYCTRAVDLAEMNEPVWQAAERMKQRTVGTLVIVDAERKPVGIITDRDLVVRVLSARRDPASTTVGEIMTRSPRTVAEDRSVQEALEAMQAGAFRRLPVVDHNGQLCGLVAVDDVVRRLADGFTHVGRLLERETPTAAVMG